jgi:hypothetical protein
MSTNTLNKPVHRNPKTLAIMRDVKDAILQPYAWPGGYPKAAICTDGAILCTSCLKTDFRHVAHDTVKGWNSGWRVAAIEIFWEGGNCCDQCNANVDAYPS